MAEVARICNVPTVTLRKWQKQDWWADLVNEIQKSDGQKSDNKMSRVIDKALDLIVERMEQGDYQYDQKTGRLVKVPLKARDLERVASGLFDKRQLIRKQPTNIKSSDLNQGERLLQLAEQFAKFAAGATAKPVEEKVINEYIEGDFDETRNDDEENNHSVHDQWEERLQEGAELGEDQEEESREG